MPIPRCEWKGTTALTLTTLAVTGLSIYSIMYLNAAARETCESELQNLIDKIKHTSFTTPAVHDSITEPINIPGVQIDESGGIVIDIPSRTLNITFPINIPSFTLSIGKLIGGNIGSDLDAMPAFAGKVCSDEMTMHTASYAGIIILFFLTLTLLYACFTHTNNKIKDLENKLGFFSRSSPNPKETTHLLAFAHRKNHSV